MKKKLAILLALVLLVGISAVGFYGKDTVYAKSAQMYLEIPDSIKKENIFQVNVVLESDVALYSVDAYLSYDTEMLEFVPDSDVVVGADGVLELKDTYEAETKQVSYTITFKALEVGSAEIALKDIFLIDYADLDYIEVAASVKHFEIGINKTVENDASLADLIVAPGELTEDFQPYQFEYEMYVGLDVEMIGITAIPMEEESIVDLDMPDILKVGENQITVTVTALSGNVTTYLIRVYREKIEEKVVSTETETALPLESVEEDPPLIEKEDAELVVDTQIEAGTAEKTEQTEELENALENETSEADTEAIIAK